LLAEDGYPWLLASYESWAAAKANVFKVLTVSYTWHSGGDKSVVKGQNASSVDGIEQRDRT